MSATDLLNLDAARREAGDLDHLPLTFREHVYELPVELPVDVFDPLLADDFDLTGLIREVTAAAAAQGGQDGEAGYIDALNRVLFERPRLPRELFDKIEEVMSLLFGIDEYAAFRAGRPSVKDYARIFRGLTTAYGVGLGEAFGSRSSSESGGETPKETSSSTEVATISTSDTSGDAPEPAPASSESAA